MANIKAKVTPQNKILVTNYALNASTLRIGDVFDVDASAATDGSILVYDGTSWVAKNNLDNQNTIINGGNF